MIFHWFCSAVFFHFWCFSFVDSPPASRRHKNTHTEMRNAKCWKTEMFIWNVRPGNTFARAPSSQLPAPPAPPGAPPATTFNFAAPAAAAFAAFLCRTENPILFAFSLTANNKTEIWFLCHSHSSCCALCLCRLALSLALSLCRGPRPPTHPALPWPPPTGERPLPGHYSVHFRFFWLSAEWAYSGLRARSSALPGAPLGGPSFPLLPGDYKQFVL